MSFSNIPRIGIVRERGERRDRERERGFHIDVMPPCNGGLILERETSGPSPLERERNTCSLTLPLKLERGGRTCPAWIP